MKRVLILSFTIFLLIAGNSNLLSLERNTPLIIDHNCIKLDKIPENYVEKAKQNLRIIYGHTSHGSQITTGMNILKNLNSSLFAFNSGNSSLSYSEKLPGDLGNPNRTQWAKSTRERLDRSDNDRNMVMWSWCGQVSSATESDINTYLTLMAQLEKDYPDVIFVYMTGHLDGTGEEGNLNQRNNQIRDFCKKNNKILFDFADIESHDPDGRYFLDKGANDGCYYYDDNHKRKNWADEWCNAHPGECPNCGCAHSKCLNCKMKGIAFWWMLASIEGWQSSGQTDVKDNNFNGFNLKISPNPSNNIIHLYMDLPDEGNVNYEIYSISGLKITSGNLGWFSKGYYPSSIDISNLAKGIYFVKLSSGGNWISKTFIKIE